MSKTLNSVWILYLNLTGKFVNLTGILSFNWHFCLWTCNFVFPTNSVFYQTVCPSKNPVWCIYINIWTCFCTFFWSYCLIQINSWLFILNYKLRLMDEFYTTQRSKYEVDSLQIWKYLSSVDAHFNCTITMIF